MNTGIGLGILALIQLIIAWASDRSLEAVDKPLFSDQVRKYPALGIKKWFEATEPNNPGPAESQRFYAWRASLLRLGRRLPRWLSLLSA